MTVVPADMAAFRRGEMAYRDTAYEAAMDVTRLAPLLAERGFRVDVALRKATLAEIKRRRTQIAADLGFNPASLPQLKAALKALKLPARANLRTEALESLRPYGSGTVDAVLEWRRLAPVRADLLALKGAWVTALLSTTDNAAGYPVARAADHIAHSVNLHRLCPEAWECLEAPTEGWALERVPVAPSTLTVLADLVGDPTLLVETTPGAVELCYAYGPQQFSAAVNAGDGEPMTTGQSNVVMLDFLQRHQGLVGWWHNTEMALAGREVLKAVGGRVAQFWPHYHDGRMDAATIQSALKWQVEARQADAAVAGLLVASDAETSQRRVLTLHGLSVVWEVAP